MYATCASHYYKVDEKTVIADKHLHMNLLPLKVLETSLVELFTKVGLKYQPGEEDILIKQIADDKLSIAVLIRATMKAIANKERYFKKMCEDAGSAIYHDYFMNYELRAWYPIMFKSKYNYKIISTDLATISFYDPTALALLTFTNQSFYTTLKEVYDIEKMYKSIDTFLGKMVLIVLISISIIYFIEKKLLIIFYIILVFFANTVLTVRLILISIMTLIHMSNYPTSYARETLQLW